MDYEIRHQPEQKLFETEVDGRTALFNIVYLTEVSILFTPLFHAPLKGRG